LLHIQAAGNLTMNEATPAELTLAPDFAVHPCHHLFHNGQPKAVRGLRARGFGHRVKSFIRRILIPPPPNRAIELGAPVAI
jgi:hypothetical protein